jgi:hypothetical protein
MGERMTRMEAEIVAYDPEPLIAKLTALGFELEGQGPGRGRCLGRGRRQGLGQGRPRPAQGQRQAPEQGPVGTRQEALGRRADGRCDMSRRPIPTKRTPREPVIVRHPPILGEEHEEQMRPYRSVPYPYRLGKIDGAWLFVLFLFAGGFAFKPLWLLAGFITAMRVLVYLCFRFPMTMVFFTAFARGLMSGRRRRRW